MKPRLAHCVPIEAVRQGVTADGAVTLSRLAADRVEFRADAVAELFPDGWVATVVYSKPGHPGRVHHAHVSLCWAPMESAAGAGA